MVNKTTIIIGSGPAGASAAIYLARYKHKVILIDAAPNPYGRTHYAYDLDNYLTHTQKVSGPQFIKKIDKQLAIFSVDKIKDKVVKVSKDKSGFKIKTKKGKVFKADYVVIAVGVLDGYIKLNNIDDFYDNGIYHCITCNWWQNRKRKMVIVSNSDEGIVIAREIVAMERPPYIAVIPENEGYSYSRNEIELAKKAKIPIFESPLAKINGQDKFIINLGLVDGTIIDAQCIFTILGYQRRDKFLDEGKIKLMRNEGGFIKVDFKTFESSLKNLFAVGPCNDGPDQAVIAAGQGAMAALEIHKRIITEKIS